MDQALLKRTAECKAHWYMKACAGLGVAVDRQL